MVYAKLNTKGRFLSRSEVGLFCFGKRGKKLGEMGIALLLVLLKLH